MSAPTRYTASDASDIANCMAVGPELVDRNIKALRTSLRTLATQLRNEQRARLDAESCLRGELEELRAELASQRRVIAQMMREREPIETVCGWCGKHMSGPVGAPPECQSHGICPECAVNMEPELAVT